VRSVLAVVAGYLFLTVLGRSANYALGAAFGPDAARLLSLLAVFVLALAAGHLCGRVAGRNEFGHAAVLAGILGVIGLGLLASPPPGASHLLALFEVAISVFGVLAGGFVRAAARAD
jgi:hypothetical protein